MTTPAPRDLTAIVEKVARALYAQRCELATAPQPSWEELDAMDTHRLREWCLPIVVATIRAIDEEDE